ALEFARDFTPCLDFGPTLAWIDARAAELAPRLARAADDEQLLTEISRCLAGEHGLTGSPEVFESAAGSCLDRVIETRRGIPMALSLIYRAVAAKQHIDLLGVCAPGHFLLRYNTPLKPLFVDPFNNGRIVTYADATRLIEVSKGISRTEARRTLAESTTRAIALRLLRNLKALSSHAEDWRKCALVQDRLLALEPGSFEERRDWGMIQLKAGRPGPALSMLEKCLRNCPEESQKLLNQKIVMARGQLAAWN
ncbi:MAG: SirB1 family protein, partial [Planctomycetaceae bacterium]